MTPDRRGYGGLLDAEQVPLEWREIEQLEASLHSSAHLARAFAELRDSRRRAERGDDIASLRDRIREHEQEREAWAAAGKRLRFEADKQIDQLRRDFEATSERAVELARRVSALEEQRDQLLAGVRLLHDAVNELVGVTGKMMSSTAELHASRQDAADGIECPGYRATEKPTGDPLDAEQRVAWNTDLDVIEREKAPLSADSSVPQPT